MPDAIYAGCGYCVRRDDGCEPNNLDDELRAGIGLARLRIEVSVHPED